MTSRCVPLVMAFARCSKCSSAVRQRRVGRQLSTIATAAPTTPLLLQNRFQSAVASSSSSCQDEIVGESQDKSTLPDHFDTLGMERSFSVDDLTLKRNYKALMSKLHPDLHRNASHAQQDAVHDQASNVTQAYRTLKNPQHRALHLLDLMGKPLDETATASLLGPDFLMDIMEIREAIDEASDQAEIQRLLGELNGHLSMTTRQLADAFEHDKLECALKLTAELQYWNRAQETLREKLIVS